MRFLLQIANKLEWNNAIEKGEVRKEQGLRLLEIIHNMCKQGSSHERSGCEEQEFIATWEQLVDKN